MRRLAVLSLVAGMTISLSGASTASASTIWCDDAVKPACAIVLRVVCKYQPRICEVTALPE